MTTSPLMQLLQDEFQNDNTIHRLDLPDTKSLEILQKEMIQKVESLHAQAQLASFSAPSFRWWQITGTWPRDDGGWVVLLGKATFQAQAAHPGTPNGFRHPGDGQRGTRR